MEQVFITGCAGFIGSHLAEKLLSTGAKVVGIDNFDEFYPRTIKEQNLLGFRHHQNFTFIEGDINDLKNYPKQKFDFVFHLAAKAGVRPSIDNPGAYLQVNVNGTHQLLNWMQLHGSNKLLFASSSSVYGNNKNTPFRESDTVDFPISPYAATKKAGELLNHTFHHLYKIDIINLRFFTVYGPRQRPDLAINKFFTNIINNKPIEMYGDGATARDYTFIADIINGIILAKNHLANNKNVFETINLGNNHPILLRDLIEEVYKITGAVKNIKQLPKQAGDVECTYASIEKAAALLQYKPSTTLNEGLTQFYHWLQSTLVK
jgi:UDP-glucuronate 4-epimerase